MYLYNTVIIYLSIAHDYANLQSPQNWKLDNDNT